MIFWILFLPCLEVITANLSGNFGSENPSHNIKHKKQAQERYPTSVGLKINEITNVDFEKSTYKAAITVILIVKNLYRNRTSSSEVLRQDHYLMPFSGIQISSKQIVSKDMFRSVKNFEDGSSSSISSYEAEMFCPFKLENYPFDVQRCPISIFTTRYPEKYFSMAWINEDAVELRTDALPSNVQVTLSASEQCDFDAVYMALDSQSRVARFACVRAWLQFARPIGLSIARFLLPTGAAVVVSFTAAYIDRNNIQTRVLLIGFSSILFCLIAMNIKNGIPSTVYLTAADFWIGLCAAFIFLSFIEIIITNVLMNLTNKRLRLASKDKSLRLESQYRHEREAARKEQYNTFRLHVNDSRSAERKRHDTEPSIMQRSDYDIVISEHFHRQADYYSMTAARIDLIARIIFPIAFAIATLVYVILFIIL